MTDQTIMLLLGFAAALIGLITPIIKLNSIITKLDVHLKMLQEQTEKSLALLSDRVTQHGKEIEDVRELAVLNEEKIKRLYKE